MAEDIANLRDFIRSKSSSQQRSVFFERILDTRWESKAPLFVETGCTYHTDGMDGLSTPILAAIAKNAGGRLVSVDIAPSHCETAKALCGSFGLHPDIVLSDSIDFMSRLGEEVSFVYLDSFDYRQEDFWRSQAHQLAEVGAICGKLSADAIILLDDVNLPGGGKAAMSEMFLLSRGWRIIARGTQSMLTRRPQ